MKIPIKKYVDDPSLSWEERYEKLMRHHEEETSWLISEVKKYENEEPECQTCGCLLECIVCSEDGA